MIGIRGDSHVYLQVTLLDKKGGLPVIFCSKRSKDDVRGGKFMQRVGIHHHDHQLLYLLSLWLRLACKSNVVEYARIECKCMKRFRLTSKGQVRSGIKRTG